METDDPAEPEAKPAAIGERDISPKLGLESWSELKEKIDALEARIIIASETGAFNPRFSSDREQERIYETIEYARHAFFIIMLSGIFVFYYFGFGITVESKLNIDSLALASVTWGMIGSLFQDIWYLWKHVLARDYRQTWMVRYISAPFIGGIFGAIVYLVITAGLVVLSDKVEGPRALIV